MGGGPHRIVGLVGRGGTQHSGEAGKLLQEHPAIGVATSQEGVTHSSVNSEAPLHQRLQDREGEELGMAA